MHINWLISCFRRKMMTHLFRWAYLVTGELSWCQPDDRHPPQTQIKPLPSGAPRGEVSRTAHGHLGGLDPPQIQLFGLLYYLWTWDGPSNTKQDTKAGCWSSSRKPASSAQTALLSPGPQLLLHRWLMHVRQRVSACYQITGCFENRCSFRFCW